jgi:hypothetical protein
MPRRDTACEDHTEFDAFVSGLEDAASSVLRGNKSRTGAAALFESDSVSSHFRQAVPLEDRKASGAFLTSSRLAAQVVHGAPRTAVVWDPACGAGDLLLSHAVRLTPRSKFEETLDEWGSLLLGSDTSAVLVRAARARLVLAAAAHFQMSSRTNRSTLQLDSVFPHIRLGNGLAKEHARPDASHVFLNPPFTMSPAPAHCTWTTGKVNNAAVFVDSCITTSKPGTKIVAILPDVLRSGSRYRGWRASIEQRATVDSVEVIGRFDPHTNVDVFVLRISTMRHKTISANATLLSGAPWVAHSQGLTVADFFRVSVGPLVAYREPRRGPYRRYLDVARAKPVVSEEDLRPSRRYAGKVVQTPFVTVRRTSSPSDRHRLLCTIVRGDHPVAVENHLVVLQPYDKRLESCEELVDHLKQPAIAAWMNSRIRCRHLTVDSVREIPYAPAWLPRSDNA